MQALIARNNQYFFGAIAAAIIYDTLSLAWYTFPQFGLPLFFLFAAAIFSATLSDKRWLIILPAAELAWGSFGSSFEWQIGTLRISIRMLLFTICLLVSLIHLARDTSPKKRVPKKTMLTLCVVGTIITWGIVRGIAHNNRLDTLYTDVNGYFFLAYLPVWLHAMKRATAEHTMTVLFGIATALAIKTLVLYNVFLNQYEFANVGYLYLWVRDTRIGEITSIGGSLWRIFIQSQIYIATAATALVCSLAVIRERLTLWYYAVGSLLLTAIIVSFSRSFWLGVSGSIIVVTGIMLFRREKLLMPPARTVFTRLFSLLCGVIVTLAAITAIPYAGGNDISRLLYSRVVMSGSDPAGASRILQLRPLISAIAAHPFSGSGFGAEVTYESRDPRVRNTANPTGTITTYAFEWGYLDQLLKLGLPVFVGFMVLLISLVIAAASRIDRGSESVLFLAVTAGLVCVAITSVTSPYLNHPLGLGFLALAFAIITIHPHEKTHT